MTNVQFTTLLMTQQLAVWGQQHHTMVHSAAAAAATAGVCILCHSITQSLTPVHTASLSLYLQRDSMPLSLTEHHYRLQDMQLTGSTP